MSEVKLVQIPESLDGSRVDAGLAKMLGISRTTAADLAEASKVISNGKALAKSDRLAADQLVEVELGSPKNALQIKAVEVPGFKIVFQDEHIVVVDKPAGVASHPSVGWDGPTVPGALLGLGIQLSTSGASERQGIVQRLDAVNLLLEAFHQKLVL
jgi:23S rRNA pseudouridine1911/1915/1917 synthase